MTVLRLKNELTRLRLSKSPGIARGREIFEELLEDNGDDEHRTYFEMFKNLGSSNEASYLLSAWDQDCFSGIDTFFKSKFPFIFAVQVL